jgi:hypothetical protein
MIINVHMSSHNAPLFLSYFNEIELSGQILEKSSNMKFHESTFSGSRLVPCGRMDIWMDRQTETDMPKLILATLRTRLIKTLRWKGCTARLEVIKNE